MRDRRSVCLFVSTYLPATDRIDSELFFFAASGSSFVFRNRFIPFLFSLSLSLSPSSHVQKQRSKRRWRSKVWAGRDTGFCDDAIAARVCTSSSSSSSVARHSHHLEAYDAPNATRGGVGDGRYTAYRLSCHPRYTCRVLDRRILTIGSLDGKSVLHYVSFSFRFFCFLFFFNFKFKKISRGLGGGEKLPCKFWSVVPWLTLIS
jgi:hypothetical protein